MSDPYLGEIRLFAGGTPPQGWRFCDGSVLTVSTNQALYALLGNTYGGTAPTTFALPDLRGRVPIGTGQGTAVAPGSNSAVSLTPRTLGNNGGAETVTLAEANLPPHSHALTTAGTNGTASTANESVTLANVVGQERLYVAAGAVPSRVTTVTAAAGTIGQTGTGNPHDNMMPAMALNYIIALTGLFPVRT